MNDLMMQLRNEKVAEPPIVIVWIDDLSAMSYGFRSPTPRILLADLITALSEKNASVIALDFLLDQPHLPKDDSALVMAIQQSDVPVVLTTPGLGSGADLKAHSKKYLVPPLNENPTIGFSEVLTGANDIVRWIRIAESEQQMGSLVSESYAAFTGKLPDGNNLKSQSMPYGWLRLNFWRAPTFLTTSNPGYQNFSAQEVPYLPSQIFEGKIVLIGSGIDILGDTFLTPFSTTGNSYQLSFGVELHALALEMLLNQRLLEDSKHSHVYPLLWFTLLLIFISVLYFRPLVSVVVFIASVVCWWWISFYLFTGRGLLVPIVGPWVLMLTSFLLAQAGAIFKGQKQARFIRSTFKQYVSPDVVDTLLKNPEELELGGKLSPVSIIFTDLEGFTSISEKLAPQEVVARLNEYLDLMNQPIFDQGGTLDKYIGDAIMAYYGAPIEQEDQADRACRTAVMMQLALQRLNDSWREKNMDAFRMRVGIHSSKVVVGNIGSQNKMDYTVIGDGVNIAARLEGINKLFGTEVIASQDTLNQVTVKTSTRELGKIQVKGKQLPVVIFQLCGVETYNYLSLDPELVAEYHKALQLFYHREFVPAADIFKTLSEQGDKASAFLHAQAARFSIYPPDENWDGTISAGDFK